MEAKKDEFARGDYRRDYCEHCIFVKKITAEMWTDERSHIVVEAGVEANVG